MARAILFSARAAPADRHVQFAGWAAAWAAYGADDARRPVFATRRDAARPAPAHRHV